MEPITTKTKVIRWALGVLIGIVVLFGIIASTVSVEESESCETSSYSNSATSPF